MGFVKEKERGASLRVVLASSCEGGKECDFFLCIFITPPLMILGFVRMYPN
jgi:hypothetical protein